MSTVATDIQAMLKTAGVPMLKTSAAKKPAEPKARPLSADLTAALRQQVGNEAFAAYSYLGVSAWFRQLGLEGFARYHERLGNNGIGYAKKIFAQMLASGAEASLPAIPAPLVTYDSPEHAARTIMEYERQGTASWRAIAEQAVQDKNEAVLVLSDWFLKVQLSEEQQATLLYQRLQMTAGKAAGLQAIDKELTK